MASKSEIVRLVSKKSKTNVEVTRGIVEGMLSVMKDELLSGREVTFRGFGVFSLVERKAKVGQNMFLGESIVIPAYTTIKFKPLGDFGNSLKEVKVNTDEV